MYRIAIHGKNIHKTLILKSQISKCFSKNESIFIIDIIEDNNQITPDTNILFCLYDNDNYCSTKSILEMKKISPSIYTIIIISNLPYKTTNYDITAENYLVGEYTMNDLRNRLFSAVYNIDSSRKFMLRSNNSNQFIRISDILYIESYNRAVKINMNNKIINVRNTLSFIEQQLKSLCLFKCHQSFIVNLNYIESIYTTKLTLTNGTEIQISRGYKDNFRDYVNEYFHASGHIDLSLA